MIGAVKRWIVKRVEQSQYYAGTVRPGEVASQGRAAALSAREYIARYHGWAYLCACIQADAVAAIPLRVYRRGRPSNIAWRSRAVGRNELRRIKGHCGTYVAKALEREDDSVEIIDPNNPIVRLLSRPNPMQTGSELIKATQVYLELTGRAPWMVTRDGAEVDAIFGLSPAWFRAVPDGVTGLFSHYIYGRDPSDEQTLELDDVVYLREFDPADPYGGKGWLQAALDAVDLSFSILAFRQNYIEGGMQPGLVVVLKKGATDAERKRVEAELTRKHRGPLKAGRSLVLTGDAVATPWMGKEEIPLMLSDDQLRDRISAMSGVPKAMLTSDDVNLANGRVAAPHWQILAVRPRSQRLETAINEGLIPLLDVDDDDRASEYFVAFDNPVVEDEEAIERRVVSKWQAGLLRLDEARDELNYDAIGGAEGDAFFTAQSPSGFSIPLLGGGGGGGASPERAPTRLLMAPPERIVKTSALWLDPAVIKRSASGVNPIVLGLEAAIREWYGLIQPSEALTAAQQDRLISLFSGELDRLLQDPLRSAFGAGFDVGVDELGERVDMGDFGSEPEGALRFLDQYRIRLAREITGEMEGRLRGAIAESLRTGETLAERTARVGELLGEEQRYVAERIARTEGRRALMQGRERAWMESEIVVGKQWILSRDPCELCVALAAKHGQAKLGEPFLALGATVRGATGTVFTIDYSNIDGAPAHPNCECSMQPVYAEGI